MESFSAPLIRDDQPTIVYTRVYTPFSVEDVFGVKGPLPVVATVDGVEFRSTLMPAGNGQHSLIVNGVIQKKIRKKAGAMVQVTIERDPAPRELEMPDDFDNALENNLLAKAFFFDVLPPSRRKGLVGYINEAKTVETRLDRIEKLCAKMADKKRNNEKPGPSILWDGE